MARFQRTEIDQHAPAFKDHLNDPSKDETKEHRRVERP